MAHEGLRTSTAQQAMRIADIVNGALADRIVGAEPPRRLMVMDVNGPSTEGGKRARQAIVLMPVHEGERGAAMCGFIDTARREVELRTYGFVADIHLRRYGRPFDVTEEEYDQLVGELVELFALDTLEVRFVDADASPAVAAPKALIGTDAKRALVLALAVLLVALTARFLLR
jgi:hypothetical protein